MEQGSLILNPVRILISCTRMTRKRNRSQDRPLSPLEIEVPRKGIIVPSPESLPQISGSYWMKSFLYSHVFWVCKILANSESVCNRRKWLTLDYVYTHHAYSKMWKLTTPIIASVRVLDKVTGEDCRGSADKEDRTGRCWPKIQR